MEVVATSAKNVPNAEGEKEQTNLEQAISVTKENGGQKDDVERLEKRLEGLYWTRRALQRP